MAVSVSAFSFTGGGGGLQASASSISVRKALPFDMSSVTARMSEVLASKRLGAVSVLSADRGWHGDKS